MTIDYTIILPSGLTLRDALEEDLSSIPWDEIRAEVGAQGLRQIAINAGEAGDMDLARAANAAASRYRCVSTITITVDEDNNAESWWDAARACADAPAEIRALIGVGSTFDVEVSADAAVKIRAWAESLPGWSGGPVYAPHPLIFR